MILRAYTRIAPRKILFRQTITAIQDRDNDIILSCIALIRFPERGGDERRDIVVELLARRFFYIHHVSGRIVVELDVRTGCGVQSHVVYREVRRIERARKIVISTAIEHPKIRIAQ